ncbi:S-adenosyl-L-methionine-dependent methyltransferase [Melanogaster broomeanus]|nr:S-adenosyl-L-methionine-dependent methyltransferase [Melanogaster broomeanus]
MTLLKRYGLLSDLCMGIQIAFWPTFKQIWAKPTLLLHPTEISRIFMSSVWSVFGQGIDENSVETKKGLITQHAHGVVLDVGAAYGHTAKYLDKTRVTKYVALEPNTNMHDELRRAANAAGFTEALGSFVLLSCGAEDTTCILTSLGGYQPVDTIISILTLCSVPDPQDTIRSLATEVLKPGGQVLFYEHVRNPNPNIAWWQTFWNPLWGIAFDGCKLDRPTHLWVQEVGGWEKEDVWGFDDEDEEHLFWHRLGRFVKAA